MEALATFVESEAGEIYGRVCQFRGVDPGAIFEAEDDVLAYNLAAALMLKLAPGAEEPLDELSEGKVVTDLERRMRG